MKSLVILITGLFGLVLFDLRLVRRIRRFSDAGPALTIELNDQKQKLKKVQRKYNNAKYKKRKCYGHRELSYKDSRPRDVRFSNQKTLRKMYRNG